MRERMRDMNGYTQKMISVVVFSLLLLLSMPVYAQQDPLFTQYVNSPLSMNAAYTGNRNSLALDLGVRQQWVGVEGAPKSYYLSAHSPINKSRVSLGGYLLSDEAGPVVSRQVHGTYSYLVRMSNKMFLSLGASGGVHLYNIGLTGLNLGDAADPYFGFNITNRVKPSFGVGAVLFTPNYYVALSCPQLLLSRFSHSGIDSGVYASDHHFYLNGGYTYVLNKHQSMRFSSLVRLLPSGENVIDLNVIFNYNKYLWVGASYRFGQALAGMLNFQLNRNWGICYSYDFYTNRTSYFNSGAHEITLSYDCYKFYKKNKYRNFKRKSADKEEEMRSIRYF